MPTNLHKLAGAAIVGLIAIGVWSRWNEMADRVPPGVTIEEPPEYDNWAKTPTANPFGLPPTADADSEQLIHSFSNPAISEANVSVDLPFLAEFAGPNRGLLVRHLATSAKWFLVSVKVNGKETVSAIRRFPVRGMWHISQNGFLSSFTIHPNNYDEHYQFLISLDTSSADAGPAWRAKSTFVTAGKQTASLRVMPDGMAFESMLVVGSAGATLSIYEESGRKERAFTPLALAQLKNEFESVLSSPTAKSRGFDPALMPKESLQIRPPEMHLINEYNKGIYQIYAYVNPGEDGHVYLKLFKGGGNTPVGDPRDYTGTSIEKIGWSSDAHEQFLYNTMMVMDAAGWTDPFVTRFEIWFSPNSGKSDRKLFEKYFSVHYFE